MKRRRPHRSFPLLALCALLAASALGGCDKQIMNPNLNLQRLLPYASKKPFVFFTQTTDGKSIALHRTEPNIIREGLPPLLLLHDEGTNQAVWEVVRVERRTQDAALFVVPADAQRMQVPNMPGMPRRQ